MGSRGLTVLPKVLMHSLPASCVRKHECQPLHTCVPFAIGNVFGSSFKPCTQRFIPALLRCYIMVHLRHLPPIAKLTAHPLHQAFPLWNTRGRAVSVSGTLLSRAFSAQSWELFSRVTIRNQLSLPPNRKYQARREIPHKETWALSLAWKGSNSPIRCNMLLTPPYSILKMA